MTRKREQIRIGATLIIAVFLGAACGTDSSSEEATSASSIAVESSTNSTAVESSTTTAQSTSTKGPDPVLDGPTTPMAVVGIPPGEQVPAYAAASADEEVVGSISGSSMFVDVLVDEEATSGGSTWRYVKRFDSRPVNGWIDAAFLRGIEGDTTDSADVLQAASLVRRALSAERASLLLADRTAAVRVSADNTFTDADPVILSGQLAGGFDTTIDWGPTVGGESELSSTVADFFQTLRGSKALQETERLSINARVLPDAATDNTEDFFTDATMVELYYSGDGRDGEGNVVQVWESLLLVFQIRDRSHVLEPDGYELFGLAVDGGVSTS